jgi:hypothetical protein
MRVDRMQHALSILESVMDDTLRVSQGTSSDAKPTSTAAALRQSMDAAARLKANAPQVAPITPTN